MIASAQYTPMERQILPSIDEIMSNLCALSFHCVSRSIVFDELSLID
jgi:hypothetical protein